MKARGVWLAAAAAVLGLCSGVRASNRPFAYTYTLYPAPAGQFEIEQWAEFKGGSDENTDKKSWNFREEFEYAPTDNLSLALYLPKWKIEDSGQGNGWNSHFDAVAFETIWYLTNPVTDPIGIGLYGEVGAGEEEASAEAKLLLQKDIGSWVFAYNLILETEIENAWGHEKDTEGELGHSFAVARSVGASMRVGGEVVVKSAYEQWRHYEGTTVYAGPSFSYQGGAIGDSDVNWWVAVTPLVQVTDVVDESNFKARMIFGLEF